MVKEIDYKESKRQQARLALLSARFFAAGALRELMGTEVGGYAYMRESDILELIPVAQRTADHAALMTAVKDQVAACRRRLFEYKERVWSTLGELHRQVLHVAALYSEELEIQRQCERILRLPFYESPRPGPEVMTLEAIVAWERQASAAVAKELEQTLLVHIDRLWDLVARDSSQPTP